ncbi:MAG TPA: alpha/beta hydrolase, partial [Firmicutes bacterium]|nr:alpha/beta hydrolase [Bacillota bacterium]
MREKTVHIEVLGRKLFGMVHLPEGAGPFPGLILYHGFTGSSIEQHRLFVKIARAAVKTGTVCVRFDFSGAGQSEGCSEDYDFNDWTDDALEIYKFTRGLPEVDADRISAGGFSMGAAVLMYLHSEKKTAFFKHIYMAPAVDLPEIIPGIMENAKDRGDYFDVWGNKISKKAMRAAMETDLFSRAHGPFPESAVYH